MPTRVHVVHRELVRRLVSVLLTNVHRCIHIIMLVRGGLLDANLALQLPNALLILLFVGIQALRLAQLIFVDNFLRLHLVWPTIHLILLHLVWLLVLSNHDLRQHVVVASLFVLAISGGVSAGLTARVLWRRWNGAWRLKLPPRRRICSLHRWLRPWPSHIRLLHELRRHGAGMMALWLRLGVQSVVWAHRWMRRLVVWKEMLAGVRVL